MSKKYNFTVTGQKRESYLPDMEEKITITVSEEELKSINFYFLLRLQKDSKTIEVRDITLRVGVSWQDMETIAYLRGKFNFDDEREINQALLELKKDLNKDACCIDGFHASWREVHMQFIKWFTNEFCRYLDNQIKGHDILLNLKARAE
jgi:hypothetical protein